MRKLRKRILPLQVEQKTSTVQQSSVQSCTLQNISIQYSTRHRGSFICTYIQVKQWTSSVQYRQVHWRVRVYRRTNLTRIEVTLNIIYSYRFLGVLLWGVYRKTNLARPEVTVNTIFVKISLCTLVSCTERPTSQDHRSL